MYTSLYKVTKWIRLFVCRADSCRARERPDMCAAMRDLFRKTNSPPLSPAIHQLSNVKQWCDSTGFLWVPSTIAIVYNDFPIVQWRPWIKAKVWDKEKSHMEEGPKKKKKAAINKETSQNWVTQEEELPGIFALFHVAWFFNVFGLFHCSCVSAQFYHLHRSPARYSNMSSCNS